MSEFISLQEVSDKVFGGNVTARSLYHATRSGALVSYKIRRRILTTIDDAIDYAKGQRKPNPSLQTQVDDDETANLRCEMAIERLLTHLRQCDLLNS
jgi:hypothetical protein